MIVANKKENSFPNFESSQNQIPAFAIPQQLTLNTHKLSALANRHSIFSSAIPPIDINSLIKKDQMSHDSYEEDETSFERTPMLKKTESILVESNDEALKAISNKNKPRIFESGMQKGFVLPCLSEYYVRNENELKIKCDAHEDLEKEASLSNQDLMLFMENSEEKEENKISEGDKNTFKQEKQSIVKLGKKESFIFFCLTVVLALGIIFVKRIV